MLTLKGSAVASSAGIVLGSVQKLDHKHQFLQEYKITEQDVEFELQRFHQAIERASDELQVELEQLATHQHAADLVPILETHSLMLHDPELVDSTCRLIREELINAEWALKKVIQRITKAFDHITDVYLRSRKEDVEHVGQRIFSYLTDEELPQQKSESIMVAMDFSPSDIVSMWRSGVAGFVAIQGGKDSHTMIVARGVGLPGITGVKGLFEHIEDGDQFILDAEQLRWILHPQTSDLEHYEKLQQDLDKEEQQLQFYVDKKGSIDGMQTMPLMVNLEFLEEVAVANKYGADGVGLFRTEFLFMHGKSLPSEDEQFLYYSQIVQGMKGKPVTFRLLDIGADKLVHTETLLGLYDGENPALGLRGVRLLLDKPEILREQLRAIVRTSQFAEVSVLVPMVSSVEEMVAVRSMLNLVKEDLGITAEIKLGCMIEVPAAAFIASDLAKVSDFFSIGSNDLVQYSLAVDRADEHVSYLYDAAHPAVLKLIHMTMDAARIHGIQVAICGELASNPQWTEIFLDLNICCLSMSARKILPIRKQLHHLQALS